jgi:hypothetical protein
MAQRLHNNHRVRLAGQIHFQGNNQLNSGIPPTVQHLSSLQ